MFKVKRARSSYTLLALGILPLFSYGENYWQKSLVCEDRGAGHAYFDVDLANRYNVQLVIKNKEIIRYLTTNLRYQLYPGQVRIYDGGETAVISGSQSHPVFSPNDVRGFQHTGTIGSGYGWYPGLNVIRQNDIVKVEIVHNGYYHCKAYVGIECVDGFMVPSEVAKDWIFRNCH